jgi:UDP-N-acetyl-D-glucosamine dehydrogenase
MQNSWKSVVVVGQGYVGLPLSMAAVDAGHTVFGVEPDEGRLKQLSRSESYVEDVSSARLRAAFDTGRYAVGSAPAAAGTFDVAVITVPTPQRAGRPDLSYVIAAGESLGPLLRPGVTVILESTTYPGTTEEVLAPLLAERSGLEPGVDFALGYSPERIDPGNERWNLRTTPKIVSGMNGHSLSRVREFYDTFLERSVPVGGTREAELAKLLENTFRYVNIALVNELAVYAAQEGIDIWETIDAAATKPFGFMRFSPGPGVGGHCIPVDPAYLAWRFQDRLGRPFLAFDFADGINRAMPEYVIDRLEQGLSRRGKTLRGSRVLVLGLAYKANVGDVRETPARAICQRLLAAGADVRATDPHVPDTPADLPVALVPLTADELGAADAVVLLTAHEDVNYDLLHKHAPYVLDTRNRLASPVAEKL